MVLDGSREMGEEKMIKDSERVQRFSSTKKEGAANCRQGERESSKENLPLSLFLFFFSYIVCLWTEAIEIRPPNVSK